MLDYYSYKKITFLPHFLFSKISFHYDKLSLHSDSKSTEQIPKNSAHEVLGPGEGRMKPRDASQNIHHRQFWSLVV